MNVHRLKLAIVRVVRLLLRAWRQSAAATDPVHPRAAYRLRAPGSDLASARWLDDSRRLRARPNARPHVTLAQISREQLRQIFTDPRWASAYDAARAPRPPRTPSGGDAHAQQPAESADNRSAVPSRPAAASEDAGEQGASERRRLAFIRDLVRRGIYNEGFEPTHLPEQYRLRPDDTAE